MGRADRGPGRGNARGGRACDLQQALLSGRPVPAVGSPAASRRLRLPNNTPPLGRVARRFAHTPRGVSCMNAGPRADQAPGRPGRRPRRPPMRHPGIADHGARRARGRARSPRAPPFDTRSGGAISSPGRTRAAALQSARRVCVPLGVGASGSQGRMERITDSPDGQADISAQEATSRQGTRVPRPNENPGRPTRARDATREGPAEALGLTGERSHNSLRLVMLSRPGDFARLAEGGVARTHPLLVGRFSRTRP